MPKDEINMGVVLAPAINDVLRGRPNDYAWKHEELTVAWTDDVLRVQIGANPNVMSVDLMGFEVDRFFGQLSKAVGWETDEDSGPLRSIGILPMKEGRKKIAQINMWLKTPCVYSHAQVNLTLAWGKVLLEWLAPRIGWDLKDVA